MFEGRKERMNEYNRFYDSIFENPNWWQCDEPEEFTETSGLGKDGEMEKIRDQFVLIPLWCLCDGLVSGTCQTQHRHIIVAFELESSFKDIWLYKIRYKFQNSGRAKKRVKIQDAFHLARAIVNMSQRKI
ncbi:uncharacterized protein NPIL_25251 [Nephila pilipes]|uniref:Uncharacterized protein n=1 Tax=Nephila pilipes TaxID=299642 RepID=A0A8X6PF90_NEPPI|nr:uncharacterized protein NPIL_107631 [Nephila pilipes]GFU20449.1 uncharacterized protein NPIL_25251 [Nephila pilipes]